MQHRTKVFLLSEIIDLVANGQMALPEFQRDFVWDPNKVTELLDSVSNGWPIGALLVLEGPQPFETMGISGGPPVRNREVDYYLLDGQQRVTALYHAMKRTEDDVVYYLDLADLDTESEEALPFRWARTLKAMPKARMNTSHRVSDLLNPHYLAEALNAYPQDKRDLYREAVHARLGYLAGGKYQVPATIMDRGIELEALTRIFETLNRTGVQLNAFDLMVAVLYAEDFKLRDKWNQAKDENRVLRAFDIDGLEILKVIAVWRRNEDRISNSRNKVTGIRQRDILNIPGEFVARHWGDAVLAYVKALDFLQARCGVLAEPDTIPSEAMIVTLAYLLQGGELTEEEILHWYWLSIATQQYAQGANTQVIADVEELALARLQQRASEGLPVALRDELRRNKILRLGMRGLIVQRGGLDPVTGNPLTGRLTEVPLAPLVQEPRAYRPAARLAEGLICTEDSAAELRAAAKVLGAGRLVRGDALTSQGFADQDFSGSDWIEARALTIESWFEEAL